MHARIEVWKGRDGLYHWWGYWDMGGDGQGHDYPTAITAWEAARDWVERKIEAGV